MMTEQIDFYILENTEYFNMACRLLEKAYLEHYRTFVLCSNEEIAKKLDDLLWTFKDISFVPHHRWQDTEHTSSPICIHHEMINTHHKDLLVLLTDKLPGEYQLFKRIAIIVPNNEAEKQKARQLYKELQTNNINLNVHKI